MCELSQKQALLYCQMKFSNSRPFLAISPNAGSIILTREAQQRRSQNSFPNRFHSSDMRAFLESMPNVANTCCFSFLELIERKKIKDKATTTGWSNLCSRNDATRKKINQRDVTCVTTDAQCVTTDCNIQCTTIESMKQPLAMRNV